MVERPAPLAARVKVPKVDLRPESANWFHFGITNLDVQMLVGYIDPIEATRAATTAKSSGEPLTVNPMVTHRIMMSLSGFAQLRSQIHEMERKMQAAGVPALDAIVPPKING